MANPGPAISNFANQQPLNSGQAQRLLCSARAVNINVTGDAAVMPIVTSGSFVVTNVLMCNASTSLTTALAGVFTAPAAGGTAVVANAALSSMTGATVVFGRTVATPSTSFSVPSLYLNMGTSQAAAATMDVFVYGYDLT